MKLSKRTWIAISTLVGSAVLGGIAVYGTPKGDVEPEPNASAETPLDNAPQNASVPLPDGQFETGSSASEVELDPAKTFGGGGPAAADFGPPSYTNRVGDEGEYRSQGDLRQISDDATAAAPPDSPFAKNSRISDSGYVPDHNAQPGYPPEDFQPDEYQTGDYQTSQFAAAEYTTPAPQDYQLDQPQAAYMEPAQIPAPDRSGAGDLDASAAFDSSRTFSGSVGDDTPYPPSGNDTAVAQMPAAYAAPYGSDRALPSEQNVAPPPLSEVRAPPIQPPTDLQPTGSYPAYGGEAPPIRADATLANIPNAGGPLLAMESPGSRQLEGVQTPSIAVEKMGPGEIQVNIPASFQTRLRNVGRATAHGVVVTDRVPNGTEYISSTPEAIHQGGVLIWQLESLEPDEERIVSMEVMPLREGEVGSVAQVSFHTQASVRSLCTKPMLTVQHTAPESVLIGDDVVFEITVSNPGTGAATNVVIEEDVPEGLQHPAGTLLESELGTLQPNETRKMELVVKAAHKGLVRNIVRVRGNGELAEESISNIEVVAPELKVAITGPNLRFLNRSVKYEIRFTNPGTAPAQNVELTTFLPKGLEFRAADNKGQYDSRNHAIYWSLAELPAGGLGTVSIEAMPTEAGEQLVRAEARANLGLKETAEHRTDVQAVTEIEFSVADVDDPIEIGNETTYEIRVVNNGVKTATNIDVVAVFSPGVEAIEADGTTKATVPQYTDRGQQIAMGRIGELPPRGEAVYRIRARGRTEGDHLIQVQLKSSEAPTAVVKQEGTKVYRDR